MHIVFLLALVLLARVGVYSFIYLWKFARFTGISWVIIATVLYANFDWEWIPTFGGLCLIIVPFITIRNTIKLIIKIAPEVKEQWEYIVWLIEDKIEENKRKKEKLRTFFSGVSDYFSRVGVAFNELRIELFDKEYKKKRDEEIRQYLLELENK